MESSREGTPTTWNVVSPSAYIPENLKSNLSRNPDLSKNTYYVKVNEGQYEDWHKYNEWMWTSKIKDGSFVIIIVSHRGCYVRHDGMFVNNLPMTNHEESVHMDFLKKDIRDVCTFKREEFSHNTRIIVVAPEDKAADGYLAERANLFAKQVVGVVESKTELKAKIVTYDPATVKNAIADEPEYGSVEIYFDPEKHDQPHVYMNGELY